MRFIITKDTTTIIYFLKYFINSIHDFLRNIVELITLAAGPTIVLLLSTLQSSAILMIHLPPQQDTTLFLREPIEIVYITTISIYNHPSYNDTQSHKYIYMVRPMCVILYLVFLYCRCILRVLLSLKI